MDCVLEVQAESSTETFSNNINNNSIRYSYKLRSTYKKNKSNNPFNNKKNKECVVEIDNGNDYEKEEEIEKKLSKEKKHFKVILKNKESKNFKIASKKSIVIFDEGLKVDLENREDNDPNEFTKKKETNQKNNKENNINDYQAPQKNNHNYNGNYKFKIRSNIKEEVYIEKNQIKNEVESSNVISIKRFTRSSSKSINQNLLLNKSKTQKSINNSLNELVSPRINKKQINNKLKTSNENNNKNNSKFNPNSNTNSEETEVNISQTNKIINKKEKQINPNKSKSQSKSTSKSSSALNQPLLTNQEPNINLPHSKKTSSNSNLYNFGPLAEETSDFSSDITEKLSNSLIYCRETEKKRILDFISNKDLKTLFICGQPGTGKTSLLLEIFKKDLCLINNTIKIYINFMSVHSAEDFYYQILKFLLENRQDLKIPVAYREALNSKKNLNKTLLEILDLFKSKFTFLILLDEVDNFYQKQKEIVFYEILNTPYLTDTLMKLILISNNSEFDKDVMPKIESRKIKVSRIVFKPYTHNEIYEILRKKLSDSGILEVFQDEALKLISKKLANKMGDLRPAIEIVKNLILENKEKILNFDNSLNICCDGNNNNKSNTNRDNISNSTSDNTNTSSNNKNNDNDHSHTSNVYNDKSLLNGFHYQKATKAKPLITLRDVLVKLKQKNQGFIDLMSNLTTEQKIVLLCFYTIYDKSKNSEIDERVILDTYKMIKRENFNSEFNIMDYREIIKSFCDMAIIECKNKAKGKFKIKYDLEDLELIFVDDRIFKMFKNN
jgi:Cdc6-like AAA superfamily ATPase